MKNARIVSVSDIHLGHKNNDTVSILKMLNKELIESNLISKIEILIFAGDVFDSLLLLNNAALPDIDLFFARLLRRCEQHNVIFRILEGTPSHDRGQSLRFKTLHEVIGSKADFLYVDNLRIEYIERFDCNILYIPDEWRLSNAETLEEVTVLMKEKKLSQVDITVMHGQFEYQIPVQGKDIPVHDEKAYQKLTRVIIFIGHVHTHSLRGKIAAQGSFDRLRHGEEEPKGFLYVNVINNHASVKFIENKAARIYKTIAVYGLDAVETSKKIEKALLGQPIDICLRIEAEPTHPVFTSFSQLEKQYPTVVFSKLPKDQKTGESINITVHNEFDDWKNIEITKDNIVYLILDRLDDNEFNQEDKKFIAEQIEDIK